MAKQGYDALLVSGQGMFTGRGHLRYVTNWSQPQFEEYFLFPLQGEGIYFSRYVNRANVQKKLLKLNVMAPGYGLGWNAGDEDNAKFSVTIPPNAVVGKIKELNLKSIGLCGPENMSGDFYVGLIESLGKAGIKFATASALLLGVRMIKSEEEQNVLLSRTPLKRAGTPEDVASAILWLLGCSAGYTTGALLDVGGGR